MDSRTDLFIKKFTHAQRFLGSESIQDIVSLKYGDDFGYPDPREFINDFNRLPGLQTKQIQGDFSGSGWLVNDKIHNKAILVEHETGLEFLYVAGSIASLISLVPQIGTAWRQIKSRFGKWPRDINDRHIELEIRVINSKNQLIERHIFSDEDYVFAVCLKEFNRLQRRIKQLEKQLSKQGKGSDQLRKPHRIVKNAKN